MIIDGVIINIDPTLATEDELKNLVAETKAKFPEGDLQKLIVTKSPNGGFDVDYTVKNQKFERIRRITGYLTSDLNSWNNAKRSEEHERVKHGVNDYEEKM